MITKKIFVQCRFYWYGLLALLLLSAYSGIARAEIISADRMVTWQANAGVDGDIPVRTTICSTINSGTYGNGSTDTKSAIQAAINACPSGQVVYLPAGTYMVSGELFIKSGVTLRGAGIGITTIKRGTSWSGEAIIGFSSNYSWNLSSSPSKDITGGITKGSTTITTSAAHGWSVGDIIAIDQVNDPTGDPVIDASGTYGDCTWCGRPLSGPVSNVRSLGQVNRVTAVPSSTTATLEIPLYANYNAAKSPQAVRIDGIVSNAGVEDLTVDNSLSSGYPDTIFIFAGSYNNWLLRVEGIGSWKQIARFFSAYRNTIRSGKFHEGIPATPTCGTQYGPSRGYGIWLNPWASANLVEDSSFYHLSSAIQLNGVTSGNVFAYNYISSMYYTCNGQTYAREAIGFHGAHPFMNLFEGNWIEDGIIADFGWGSSSNNTFFRNRSHPAEGKDNMVWDIDLNINHQYFNIVGNVFGVPGYETSYVLQNVDFVYATKAIYRFGYTDINDITAAGNDPQVWNTLLLHGNWDYVTDSVTWDGGIPDHTIPASMYLSSKPSFFDCRAWPGIGSDLSPMTGSLPAKDRYDGIDPCAGGGGGPDTMPPSPPPTVN